jgi:hypothetical protein
VTKRSFRFPVWREFIGKDEVYHWRIPLELRTANGTFTPEIVLFDTGSQLTTISIPQAEKLRIPFDRQRPVTIHGTTGTGIGKGFIAPMWFSLAGLPELQFESLCCFSPVPLTLPLLSLKDVIAHFQLRTLLPSRLHPLGSLVLKLHGRHKGQPRP